ncbi:MAG: cation transport ATPase [Crocinitomicaceae bacterium]|jgi:cation transport ATPase
MRLLYVLITILFLTSCGTGKIRLVRHQKIIETNETLESLAEKDFTPTDELEVRPNLKTTQDVSYDRSIDISDESILGHEQLTVLESQLPIIPEDSTNVNAPDKAEIARYALKAEKNALRSTIFSALFIFFVGLMILMAFLFWQSFIPPLVAMILALVSFTLGIAFYSKSAKSRYITARGQRLQLTALVFIIVDSLFIALVTVLSFI